MKGMRILSELGSEENKALLCEIPAEWTKDIQIYSDGSINTLGILKLLRKGFLSEYVRAPSELMPFEGLVSSPDSIDKEKAVDQKTTEISTSLKTQTNEDAKNTMEEFIANLSFAKVPEGQLPLYELIFNENLAVEPKQI